MNAAAPDVAVDPSAGIVRVCSVSLASASRESREDFLRRVFACRHVEEVSLDTRSSTAEIRLRCDTPFCEAVADLARAVRTGDGHGAAGRTRIGLPLDSFHRPKVTIRRFGGRLTTWRVDTDGGRGLRFAHPRMRRDRILARSVERLVVTLPGVLDARLEGWATDLVVRIDAGRLDADTLLAVLQHAVDERAGSPQGASPWEMVGTTTSLAVAATADFAVSALAPVSAVLLVGTNLGTMATAVGDLKRRRVGMATLATAIILGTLATGQFLASGIMAWSFDFWRRRHQRDIEAERRLILEDAVPLPACSMVDADGGPARAQPIESLTSGAHVHLGRWDVVPTDGRVAEGAGVVDDRCVTGVGGARLVRAGDRVQAGTIVLGGAMTCGIDRPFSESRVARIGELLAAATAWKPGRLAPTLAAEEFVEKLTGPTLATAGIGLLAGDVSTAVAIMRPDYANAEAMAVSFEDLDAVARGLAAGCVLVRPSTLDAIESVDTFVVVDHPALRACRLAVSRVVATAAEDDGLEHEAIRWGASLARHLADPRRDAMAAVAVSRGCVLADVVPESFGDAAGIRVVSRQAGREITLVEAEAVADGRPRPLVVAIDGQPAATFEFGIGPERTAAGTIDRIRALKPVRMLLAVRRGVEEGGDGSAESLAAELHCDGILDIAEVGLVGRVRQLMRSGHRVACVGPLGEISAAAGTAAVTIGIGGELPRDAGAIGIVSLADDIGCLADLVRAAADRRARLMLSRRLSILPNMACIAGVFLLGFTSLVAAVVSNVGTFGIYRRASASLHGSRRRHWLRHRSIAPGRLPWRKR